MNIFALDQCPIRAARYHMDVHVIKMILESLQMISTTANYFSYPYCGELLKPTHVNHPCNIWLRESFSNFRWLVELFEELLKEYTLRYGKHHVYESKLLVVEDCSRFLSTAMVDIGLTPFVMAMPDHVKLGDPVESYRNYYFLVKSNLHLAGWRKCRPMPRWYLRKSRELKREVIWNTTTKYP